MFTNAGVPAAKYQDSLEKSKRSLELVKQLIAYARYIT